MESVKGMRHVVRQSAKARYDSSKTNRDDRRYAGAAAGFEAAACLHSGYVVAFDNLAQLRRSVVLSR